MDQFEFDLILFHFYQQLQCSLLSVHESCLLVFSAGMQTNSTMKMSMSTMMTIEPAIIAVAPIDSKNAFQHRFVGVENAINPMRRFQHEIGFPDDDVNRWPNNPVIMKSNKNMTKQKNFNSRRRAVIIKQKQKLKSCMEWCRCFFQEIGKRSTL